MPEVNNQVTFDIPQFDDAHGDMPIGTKAVTLSNKEVSDVMTAMMIFLKGINTLVNNSPTLVLPDDVSIDLGEVDEALVAVGLLHT